MTLLLCWIFITSDLTVSILLIRSGYGTVLQLQGYGTVSGCSQWTFNTSSCYLFMAIMYIKIQVAYVIISYKNWKQNYNSKRVDDLTIALVPTETWLEEKLTRTLKKTAYKEMTANSDMSSKNLKFEVGIEKNVVEKSQSESTKFDTIDVRL